MRRFQPHQPVAAPELESANGAFAEVGAKDGIPELRIAAGRAGVLQIKPYSGGDVFVQAGREVGIEQPPDRPDRASRAATPEPPV